MRTGGILAAVAAATLAVAPVAAAVGNPAASLSLAKAGNVRASTAVKKGSQLAGPLLILVIIAGLGATALVVDQVDGGGDSN